LARSRALIGLVAGYRITGAHEEALTALGEAERIAAAGPHDDQLAQIHYYRGCVNFALGNRQVCIAEHERALRAARRAGAPEWTARALSGLGDGHYAGARMRTARDAFAACVALCETPGSGLGRLSIPNRIMIGHTRYFLMQFSQGYADMEWGLEQALNAQDAHAEMFARQSIGLLMTQWGHYEDAEPFNRDALHLCRKLGSRRFEASCLLQLAASRLGTGQQEETAALAGQALEIARATGTGFCGPWAVALLARASDNAARCHELLDEGTEMLRGGCVGHNVVWFYREAIEATWQADPERAAGYADALIEATSGERLPLADFVVDRAACLARTDRANSELVHSVLDRARAADLRISFPIEYFAL
jgi:tetratricopeptide (TPR) repeat protein